VDRSHGRFGHGFQILTGTAATEDACAVALEMGVRKYQFIRRYSRAHSPTSLRQIDPLIRELVHYRALINQNSGANLMNVIELNRALR
jgi:hypothetical protein